MPGPAPTPLEVRFAAHTERQANGCLLWTAAKDKDGYGLMKVLGRMQRAHRIAYELWVGPIPDGLTLDHVNCPNVACVEPTHLEPVTRSENAKRARARNAVTHCPQGHPYDENTYRGNGRRHCRACQRARNNARTHVGGLSRAEYQRQWKQKQRSLVRFTE